MLNTDCPKHRSKGYHFDATTSHPVAEEVFATDKLFPVFLHVVMMRPPIDPDLRVVQCTTPDYIFAIQPVVPSPPRSGIETEMGIPPADADCLL